ncbi:hypothetical protein DQW77_12715 [Roseovarius sp. TE539]|uniref:hypothetical protein n=1 Tax=Roseovarius sp. TE539 TaxID=2249812 RepID=UPI000DDF61B0|nr:hypothetical protein [Roseovarius sp. TE539]RBI71128.1 hypothetical protein DQW77_12715 [Roseovarius sp. TE539]
MSAPEDLAALANVTDALYRAKLISMRRIVEREAGLRRDLAALEARRQETLALATAQVDGPRRIGADVQWQGWLDGRQRRLQTELAQVMVLKAEAVEGVRRAHGRGTAAARLSGTAFDQLRIKRVARAAETLQTLACLTAGAQVS